MGVTSSKTRLAEAQYETLVELITQEGLEVEVVQQAYTNEPVVKFTLLTEDCQTSRELTFEQMYYFILGYALHH